MGNILDIDRKMHHVTHEKKSQGFRAWRIISLSKQLKELPPMPNTWSFVWNWVTQRFSGAYVVKCAKTK